jgi:phenylpropionate dioxygenase-like ring-hydroxylating dioxygenase large terminal subunit
MPSLSHLDLSDYEPSDDLATAETMPARWYTDPAILAWEKDKIFTKTWQPVGKLEDLLRVGVFLLVKLPMNP